MMQDLALGFVVVVCVVQLVDILQRRAIDGIDTYRAVQAASMKYRYDSYIQQVDRNMSHLVKTEKQLQDLSAQTFKTAEHIEAHITKFNENLEDLQTEIRAEMFAAKATRMLPRD